MELAKRKKAFTKKREDEEMIVMKELVNRIEAMWPDVDNPSPSGSGNGCTF